MSLVGTRVGQLTVLGGSTSSGTLRGTIASGGLALTEGQIKVLRASRRLTIVAPATLTGTVKVQVSPDAGVSWRYLNEDGSQVVVTANEARDFGPAALDDLRLISSAAEGADRVFDVFSQDELN